MSASSAISEQTEIAKFKRGNVRQTLEKLHSQSNDLMRLAVHWKDLENHFDSIQKTIDDEVAELDVKKKQLEWKSKFLKRKLSAIGVKSAEIDSREAELVSEKEKLDELCLEIDQTYRLVAMCHERAEEREEVLEVRSKRLRVKRRGMKRKIGALDEWEEELDLREKRLNSVERELLETIQEFEPKEKRMEEREMELRREESRFQERCSVFVDRERCLNVMIERLRGGEVEIDSADIRFYITMSGRDLVNFVCSRGNEVEVMRDEVTRAMRLSSNPGKLVLDGLQGFYGGDSEEEEVYELSVVRRSCMVLLEQLGEMKLQIRMPERQRARLLAVEWKGRMKEDWCQNLEVMGFLKLVDAYKLTYGFDKDELAGSIESAAHLPHAPALCRRLELEDKVHDIVLHLIQDKRAVEAVRFIHEFNLVDVLPPAPILRNYLERVLSAADKISKVESLTKEQIMQIHATDMKLAALVTIIRCIKEFKLDSEYPTESLEEQVLDLQREGVCCPSNFTVEEEPLIQLQTSSSTADSISLPSTETKSSSASVAATKDSNDVEFSPKLPQTSTLKSNTLLSSPCTLANRPIPPPSASFADSNLSPIRPP